VGGGSCAKEDRKGLQTSERKSQNARVGLDVLRPKSLTELSFVFMLDGAEWQTSVAVLRNGSYFKWA
jgi:hypothetical protein